MDLMEQNMDKKPKAKNSVSMFMRCLCTFITALFSGITN